MPSPKSAPQSANTRRNSRSYYSEDSVSDNQSEYHNNNNTQEYDLSTLHEYTEEDYRKASDQLSILLGAAIQAERVQSQPLSKVSCSSKAINIRTFNVDLAATNAAAAANAQQSNTGDNNNTETIQPTEKCKVTCNVDTDIEEFCMSAQTSVFVYGTKVLEYDQKFEGGRSYAQKFVYGLDQTPLETFLFDISGSIGDEESRLRLLEGIHLCLVSDVCVYLFIYKTV